MRRLRRVIPFVGRSLACRHQDNYKTDNTPTHGRIHLQRNPAFSKARNAPEPRSGFRRPWACLQVHAETDASGTLAVGERAAKAEGRVVADRATPADRDGALAVLETGADRQSSHRAVRPDRIDAGLHHRRAHRAHLADALVLDIQLLVDVVLEIG